jgi:hypothetical protein
LDDKGLIQCHSDLENLITLFNTSANEQQDGQRDIRVVRRLKTWVDDSRGVYWPVISRDHG